jgi:hypothetical protein
MASSVDRYDLRLNFNPEEPQERFKAAGIGAALVEKASERLPVAVPWPPNKVPVAAPLATAQSESDDLAKFKNYDAIVMTWTAAEAAALASLFTPGYKTFSSYEYRHRVADYIPLVTGDKAPFNDTRSDMI